MKRKQTIYRAALFAVSLLIAGHALGQQEAFPAEKLSYHMQDLKQTLLWDATHNAGGLTFMDFRNYSYAEGFFRKNNGDFVNYYESNDSYDFGVRTESFARVKKVVFYGSFEYTNFWGKNMTNSGLVYPEDYLLNLADSIPSDKRFEHYTLKGGLGVPIFRDLSGGMSIDYKTGDLAKMLDLRHQTRYLDFQMDAGLLYSFNHRFRAGVSYYYRKVYEMITFSQVAPEDQAPVRGFYYKGLWFGQFDGWKNEAVGLAERPFTDVFQGVAGQVEFGVGRRLKVFSEFLYQNQMGYSGKGPERMLTANEAKHYNYLGKLIWSAHNATHYLTAKTNYCEARNYEVAGNEEKLPNGSTAWIQYGNNLWLARNSFTAGGQYEFALGDPLAPSFVFRAGYERWQRNSLNSVNSPFYFTQQITRNDFYGYARKNFSWQRGMIDLSLMAGAGKGYGDKLSQYRSSRITANVPGSNIPQQRTDLLDKEYEYHTAMRYRGMAGVRYTYFAQTKKSGVAVYGDLSYDFVKARDIVFNSGDTAGMISLVIGVGF